MSDDDGNEELGEKGIQYTQINGVYIRCGATSQTIPAGFYRVVDATGNGNYGLKPTRSVSDDLIDIPGTVADEIFGDIDTFLATKGLYASFGLTHKRGYLFYGPPGSGKTSLGMMLSKRFIERVNGIVVHVEDEGDLPIAVGLLRDIEPGRPSMYLIEEADDIVDNAACLSILDGDMSIQGAVFVAMTNYKEDLPPRISNRPGRFDRVVKVDCPPAAVQVEYLTRVVNRNPGHFAEGPPIHMQVARIVKSLEGLPISMAHLREAFIASAIMHTGLVEIRRRFEEMVPRDDGDDDETPAQALMAALKKTDKKRR